MLQENDIQHRLQFVVRAIGQAAQAASAERGLPHELRDSIQRLDKQADSVREMLHCIDEARMRKLIVEMETWAERAKRVCINIPSLSGQMKGAVNHMHSQIQELKRDMHI